MSRCKSGWEGTAAYDVAAVHGVPGRAGTFDDSVLAGFDTSRMSALESLKFATPDEQPLWNLTMALVRY